jgi:hypothetical protein
MRASDTWLIGSRDASLPLELQLVFIATLAVTVASGVQYDERPISAVIRGVRKVAI